jgi:hypothetical protein
MDADRSDEPQAEQSPGEDVSPRQDLPPTLIEGFNSFFAGTAKAEISGGTMRIAIGDQTLLIRLPAIVGGQCHATAFTD